MAAKRRLAAFPDPHYHRLARVMQDIPWGAVSSFLFAQDAYKLWHEGVDLLYAFLEADLESSLGPWLFDSKAGQLAVISPPHR